MSVAESTRSERHPARLIVGDRVFLLEVDRIHVLGSGESAAVRIVHESIAPAHATVCFHRGRFVLEPVGGAVVLGHDDVPLRGETTLASGTTVRLGAIAVALEQQKDPGGGSLDEVAVTAAPRTDPRAPSFHELMAQELRRAPWFALSILLHALAFFLAWLLMPTETPRSEVPVRFAMADDGDLDLGDIAEAPTPEFDFEPPPMPELEVTPPMEPEAEPMPIETFEDPFAAVPTSTDSAAMFQRVTGADRAGDILGKGEGEGFTTGFRKTVAGLRSSGLEIVFAFDSTGSMGPVLRATKERMTRMVRALHALVPDARIGVVTYRDHGDREQYLTRGVPLDRDVYRALAFLETVDADGGGDRPEAVLDALQLAVGQSWSPRSRRVVVLIGDAPAHRESESQLDRLVRRFAQDGSGFVHAIITASDLLGRPERDVQRSFERVANAGKGRCVSAERDDKILEQVLSLAVGAEFRDSIDRLFELVAEREGKISTRALDLVRRLDLDEFRREFSRTVVDDDVVDALVRSGRRQCAILLIKLLTDTSLPPQGLNSAGWALQHLLGISRPLIDPENPVKLDKAAAKQLTDMAMMLR